MSNGYGSSSSSTTTTTTSTPQEPAIVTSTTNALGQVAPLGFHYMPDGTLMSDAQHASLYGSAPEEFVISDFKMDFSNIGFSSIEKPYTVVGPPQAIFSLKIKNAAGNWYNFINRAFQAAETGLFNKTIEDYGSGTVKIPTVTSADQYDIFLFAEAKTRHANYVEARFGDNTIDLNSSIGSSSRLLRKLIRQVDNITITISALSKNSIAAYTPSAITTTSFSILPGSKNIVKIPFNLLITAASTKSYAIGYTPTTEDVLTFVARTIGAANIITGEDSETSSEYSRRWKLDNVAGLAAGMVPIGTNITAGSIIADYETTTTSINDAGEEIFNVAVSIPAVNKSGTPSYSDGLINTQSGEITFNLEQAQALASDTVKFMANGQDLMYEQYGHRMSITDVEITPVQVTTTVNDTDCTGSASLATFDITSVTGIMDDVSTVSGVNINPSVADPTVTNISSNTITISAAQTLENGQTLNFNGATDKIRITGNIEFTEIGSRPATIYFDLERFLLAQ